MIMRPPRASGDTTPRAGFDQLKTTLEKVYLLQVKTASSQLDDVLYTLAHPHAVDATPGGATHADVVTVLRRIGGEYSGIATELADAYEKEFCDV